MTNVLNIFQKYDKKIINSYLNKISKNKKLNHEFLFETFFGLSIIFNWIKAVLKIFLYRYQNKAAINLKENIDSDQRNEDLDRQSLPIDSNAFNKSDLFNSDAVRFVRNKTNIVEKTVSKITAISLSIKTNENKKSTFETTIDYPLYITSTLARNNNFLSQSKFNRNATKSEQFNKTSKLEKINNKVVDKHMKLEIDVDGSKKKIMFDKVKNLPLIHVRTFRQLREHFKITNKATNNFQKDPDEIDKFSLRNEANLEKMITVLSKGNISNLNRLTVLEFCKNLEKTNKSISLVNIKEKTKLIKSINKWNVK